MDQVTDNVTSSPFSGDPVDDIETAKRIIGAYPNVDLRPLIAVAGNRRQPQSSRVAAIYALGLVDTNMKSKPILDHIVADPSESFDIRDHATEALANMAPHHT